MLHLFAQTSLRSAGADKPAWLKPGVHRGQESGIVHLSGRKIHCLFAGERCRIVGQAGREHGIRHNADNHSLVHVASNRLCSVQELAREGLIHHDNGLRGRTITIGKDPAFHNRNLQSGKVPW